MLTWFFFLPFCVASITTPFGIVLWCLSIHVIRLFHSIAAIAEWEKENPKRCTNPAWKRGICTFYVSKMYAVLGYTKHSLICIWKKLFSCKVWRHEWWILCAGNWYVSVLMKTIDFTIAIRIKWCFYGHQTQSFACRIFMLVSFFARNKVI